MKITGQLEKSYEKDTGSFKYWALVVNGQEYRAGKYAPRGINVGDWVEFDATSKQNGNYTNWTADYKTMRKVEAGASAPAAPSQEAKADFAGKARGGYNSTGNDERQEVISRQAALNTAETFLKILLDAGAITPPAKLKKGEHVQFFEETLNYYAAKFYNMSTGKTWVIETAKDEAVDEFASDNEAGEADGDSPW